MTRRDFDRWYRRAQRAFPGRLPPRSAVTVRFRSLRVDLAYIAYDISGVNVTNVTIMLDSRFRSRSAGTAKLCFREVAHELTHLLRPKLNHGVAFERFIVRVKAAMEPHPAWY